MSSQKTSLINICTWNAIKFLSRTIIKSSLFLSSRNNLISQIPAGICQWKNYISSSLNRSPLRLQRVEKEQIHLYNLSTMKSALESSGSRGLFLKRNRQQRMRIVSSILHLFYQTDPLSTYTHPFWSRNIISWKKISEYSEHSSQIFAVSYNKTNIKY